MDGLEVEVVNPPRAEPEELELMAADEELYDASEVLDNGKAVSLGSATAEEL